jgi:hypothetical protein
MPDTLTTALPDTLTTAVCCFDRRAVVAVRCNRCTSKYQCPEFKTHAALLQFNALIPPSMLSAPLPIEIWPGMSKRLESENSVQKAYSDEGPVRRLVAALGLVPKKS